MSVKSKQPQFYNDICQPVAAEAGAFFRDKMKGYRARHLAAIAGEAKHILEITPDGLKLKAPPRVVAEIIESGSWCEDEELQKLWGGLLASSATKDGKEESSLIFTDILKRMTSAEAKIVKFACETSEKKLSIKGHGEVVALPLGANYSQLIQLTKLPDPPSVEFHIGHLYSLGLLRGGGGVMCAAAAQGKVR